MHKNSIVIFSTYSMVKRFPKIERDFINKTYNNSHNMELTRNKDQFSFFSLGEGYYWYRLVQDNKTRKFDGNIPVYISSKGL